MAESSEHLSPSATEFVESLEIKVTEAALLALLQPSVRLDRFSNWLLAATGAGLGLLMANVDSLSAWSSSDRLRIAVKVLLLSAAVGAIQKMIAIVVEAHLAARESFIASVPRIAGRGEPKADRLDEDDRAAVLAVLKERLKQAAAIFRNQAPWYTRMLHGRGKGEYLADLRRTLRLQGVQGICAIVQLITLIVAAALVLFV